MDLIHAIILGLMQGITEWLPISSQGHVIGLSLAFFKIAVEQALKVAIFLHIGTLISAIIYFRKELNEIIKGEHKELRNFLAIAVIATAITAIPMYYFLKQIIQHAPLLLWLIAFFLIITGIVQKVAKKRGKAEISKKNAFFLGLGQGISVLPGISRSGMTSAVLLVQGFNPEKAFRISFLLSVPSIFLGVILVGVFEPFEFSIEAIIGIIVAAIVGYIFIDVLIRIARKINFWLFCILFGTVYLLAAAVNYLWPILF